MSKITPLMSQYLSLKEKHKENILFFRLGDFYEMFYDDALLVSKELNLTLTSRDRSSPSDERTPMCGIPHHSSEAYIARLIAKGYKVAICEQTELPGQTRGLVRREVTQVITPGTVMSASMLDETVNNYICAVYMDTEGAGLCFCDVSTGRTLAASVKSGPDEPDVSARDRLYGELCRFSPRETVLSDGAYNDGALTAYLRDELRALTERGGEWRFSFQGALERVTAQFGLGRDELSRSGADDAAVMAIGGLLSYLLETQMSGLTHIRQLEIYHPGKCLALDSTARRNLEITSSSVTGEKSGSLLGVLDCTKTSMGARLMRDWLVSPLYDTSAINSRLDAVAELVSSHMQRGEIRSALKSVSDMQRSAGRLAHGSGNCRDMVSLSQSASVIPSIKLLTAVFSSAELKQLEKELDNLSDLRELVDSSVMDQPPLTTREGGIIRAGYNTEVDRLRDILTNARGHISALETKLRDETGIKTLKVRYNKVFGYYIEVSAAQSASVPDTFIRKQTLVNCERYINQPLKELESEILGAQERVTALEFELFCELREKLSLMFDRVHASAGALARLDVLCALAESAHRNGYARPSVDMSDVIEIIDGRHPVVEKMLKDSLFVPNDTSIDTAGSRVAIITGPNMAGKSTYMRQVALIVLMAQVGSFVPARGARVGLVDRIFTRIGASDDLTSGKSTFMVEMTEVADILRGATRRSLLILDEIGRGTSTFDGMAIARAVLEYAGDPKTLGARTFFSTHYHELTELEHSLEGVVNYNVSVKKRGDDIIFLRKIVRGGADESYGIEVAKLAGLPDGVIERARLILDELESGAAAVPLSVTQIDERFSANVHAKAASAVNTPSHAAIEVLNKLRAVSLDTITPIEAMILLNDLKNRAASNEGTENG